MAYHINKYIQLRKQLSSYLKGKDYLLPKGEFQRLNNLLYRKYVKDEGQTIRYAVNQLPENVKTTETVTGQIINELYNATGGDNFYWSIGHLDSAETIRERLKLTNITDKNILIRIPLITGDKLIQLEELNYNEHWKKIVDHLNKSKWDAGNYPRFVFIAPQVAYNRREDSYIIELTIADEGGNVYDSRGNRVTYDFVEQEEAPEVEGEIYQPEEKPKIPEKEEKATVEKPFEKEKEKRYTNLQSDYDRLLKRKNQVYTDLDLKAITKQEAKQKLRDLNRQLDEIESQLEEMRKS